MARGTAIGDVENILQSEDITGQEKIPAMSKGDEEPQVVTTEELKEYVLGDMEIQVMSNLDIDRICTI